MTAICDSTRRYSIVATNVRSRSLLATRFDHTRPRFALLTFNERALCFLLMVRHQLMKISAMT